VVPIDAGGEVRVAFSEVKDARDDADPVYEGRAGQTRLRPIHVPQPNGHARSVQVYDVVNVATHPQLRSVALGGELHRFEGGTVLAIPFVYHDPAARKLALVVPEALRHDEMRLRSRLLAEMAEDSGSVVPAYAREASTVIGAAGLAQYLERASGPAGHAAPERDAELAAREMKIAQREASLRERDQTVVHLEAALKQREAAVAGEEQRGREREQSVAQREAALSKLERREQSVVQREGAVAQREAALEARGQQIESDAAVLSQREQRLAARAEDVTRREDELRTTGEEVEAAQADLAMREQELESRLEALRQREEQLKAREKPAREARNGGRASAEREPGGEASARWPAIRVRDHELVQIVDEEVEDVDELEPLATSPGDVELAQAVELVDGGKKSEPPSAASADDVEELEEIEPIETGVHSDFPPEDTDLRARERAALGSEPPKPSVAPPPEFFERRHGSSLTAIAESGGVRLFVRLPEGQDGLFSEPPELLAQFVTVDEHPVVLLSLAEVGPARPQVLRGALDPTLPEDRTVLDNLRRRFAATVGLFTAEKRYLRSIEVVSPREVNVARIMERVARMRIPASADSAAAIERALAAPPPVRTKDHPFGDDPLPATAAGVAGALEQLASWATPEKSDHALLALSIPRDRVDGTFRRILEAAADHGLAFDPRLAERAVSVGVAPDLASLVSRQIAEFQKTTQLPDRGGLSAEKVAENWERLLKLAAENEIAVDPSTHEIAWRSIREVRGGEGTAEIDIAKLSEAGPPELVLMLEHPRYRKNAALELCRRRDPAFVETICKSVRKMPRSEVVRVVAGLVPFGDDIGDALIDGLSARKTFVRQAFALALGHMKLRRAVVPLLHLMAADESDVWRETARIVGTFGNASLRAVTTQLREPKGREDRYVLCLAHLAHNGCTKQIEKLVADERPSVATMAREALTLRERARKIEEQVRGTAPLASDDGILKFSRRFYQELEGKAPEQDLEDAAGPE
jgi:hypothetical protein